MRCTSSGEVTILERSIAGVRLVVDLRCEPRFEAVDGSGGPPAPPSAVGFNPDPDPFPGMNEGM